MNDRNKFKAWQIAEVCSHSVEESNSASWYILESALDALNWSLEWNTIKDKLAWLS